MYCLLIILIPLSSLSLSPYCPRLHHLKTSPICRHLDCGPSSGAISHWLRAASDVKYRRTEPLLRYNRLHKTGQDIKYFPALPRHRALRKLSLDSQLYDWNIFLLTNLRKTLDWFKLTMRKKSNNRGKERSGYKVNSRDDQRGLLTTELLGMTQSRLPFN